MPGPDRSLVLHIYGPTEPMEGEARLGDDQPRRFASWMEMVALIERWRAEVGPTGESTHDKAVHDKGAKQ